LEGINAENFLNVGKEIVKQVQEAQSPRQEKHKEEAFLLISWLQSPHAVILEPKKIRSVTVSIVSHIFVMK